MARSFPIERRPELRGTRGTVDRADTDDDLRARLQRGEPAAFETLVREHQTALRRFASGFLGDAAAGDDVAQRALLDVWTQRQKLGPSGCLRAHLLTRARHLCLTSTRSRARAQRWLGLAAAEHRVVLERATPLDDLMIHDEEQAERQLTAKMCALIEQLEEDARVGIWMRFGGGASFEQIGEALGRPPHAVRALVYRQLGLLRKRLSEVGA